MKKSKKKFRKELVCSKCLKDIVPDQLYCYGCGEPTKLLKAELSAQNNLREAWAEYKNRKSDNYPFAIFFIFAIFIPLVFFHFFPRYFITIDKAGLSLVSNLIYLFTLPLLFIPFAVPIVADKAKLSVLNYLQSLKYYPRLLIFILINIIYFFLLKMITDSVDPILNLVRLIMVLYWLAIIVPLPHLLLRKKVNPFKAVMIVYRAGKETRWQQFFTYVYLFMINAIGLAALGVGLIITIPFSIAVLERYYLQMDKYGLFDQDRDREQQPEVM
ncbi:MAG: hypothetical protein K0B81_06175 [Candidatus Cloacimonetes bacterium]|nr:hypothetical protein [Candidatus Cloacimonadota bacterium]